MIYGEEDVGVVQSESEEEQGDSGEEEEGGEEPGDQETAFGFI